MFFGYSEMEELLLHFWTTGLTPKSITSYDDVKEPWIFYSMRTGTQPCYPAFHHQTVSKEQISLIYLHIQITSEDDYHKPYCVNFISKYMNHQTTISRNQTSYVSIPLFLEADSNSVLDILNWCLAISELHTHHDVVTWLNLPSPNTIFITACFKSCSPTLKEKTCHIHTVQDHSLLTVT
jgi:hypothetical protein